MDWCVQLPRRASSREERGRDCMPLPLPTLTNPSIPDGIRADLEEAKRCFGYQLGALPSLWRDGPPNRLLLRGQPRRGQLVEQLQELASEGKITSELKKWAEAIRWVGNEAADPGSEAVCRRCRAGTGACQTVPPYFVRNSGHRRGLSSQEE